MDIVIRATLAFLFVFLLTRIVGRRELEQANRLDGGTGHDHHPPLDRP